MIETCDSVPYVCLLVSKPRVNLLLYQILAILWNLYVLVPVVEKQDNAIHWITQLVSQKRIRWIAIYPVETVIQRLNNRGLYWYFVVS